MDPDEAVALGAAVLCGMMDGDAALENFEVTRGRAREWRAARLLLLSLSLSPSFMFIMHLSCGASHFKTSFHFFLVSCLRACVTLAACTRATVRQVMNPFQAALLRAIARRQLEKEAAVDYDTQAGEDEDAEAGGSVGGLVDFDLADLA